MRGRYGAKRPKHFRGVKLFLTSMALILVFCTIIGGTVAWIIADTDPVVNTFTYGDINIDLEESDADGDGDPDANDYPMIPGHTIEKDPKVTFMAGSENAWLFVKLEESENFDEFLEYDVILDDPATTDVVEGWTALDGVAGVYWMAVNKADSPAEFYVIKENTVTVKSDVTKDDLNALDADPSSTVYPTLTVTAYAVQRDNNITTAADAWALVEAESTNS